MKVIRVEMFPGFYRASSRLLTGTYFLFDLDINVRLLIVNGMVSINRYWLVAFITVLVCCTTQGGVMAAQDEEIITLSPPRLTGQQSIEKILQQRRSIREYQDVAISMADLGQLLWAAQGITHPQGLRTAPSAGALYPLELYVVVGRVEGLEAGTYHYDPKRHRLEKIGSKDKRKAVSRAALFQSCVKEAAAVMVFGAVYDRTTRKYGRRGLRYVHMEVGHAAQNVFLQAEALGLGTVMVGAFSDTAVATTLHLPAKVKPLALMPLGRKK